jgi:hypothetical protein
VDCSGNLWLFGGADAYIGTTGALVGEGGQNDLWEYSTSANEWTWVGGASMGVGPGPQAVYGTQGMPSIANIPGGRLGAAGWADRAGNLWLFGGFGWDSTSITTGARADLNDLWRFDPGTGTWTWVLGANTVNAVESYGTLGSAAPTNTPGARSGVSAWTDATGNFWLFGGNRSTPGSYFDDLWEFSPGASKASRSSGCPNSVHIFDHLPSFVSILFGVTNDGGGVAITAAGKIIHIPPRSPETIFSALAQNLGQVINAVDVLESTPKSASGAAGKAQARKRTKALQQSIEALGSMQTDLQKALRAENKAVAGGRKTGN